METLDQDSSIENLILKLKLSSGKSQQNSDDSAPKFPFSFPNTFDIICLKSEAEAADSLRAFDETKIDLLSELLKMNNQDGALHQTKTLDPDYIEKEFAVNFVKKNYQPFIAKVNFEDFNGEIEINPRPANYKGF